MRIAPSVTRRTELTASLTLINPDTMSQCKAGLVCVMSKAARDKLERCKRETEGITGEKRRAIRALLQAIEAVIEVEEKGLEMTDEEKLLMQELRVLDASLRSSS